MDVTPTELFERDEELVQLRGAVAAVRGGGPALVILEGPAGIGKSRLIEAACAEATAGNLRVLRAAGAELDHQSPFGVAAQLFGAAVSDPAVAAELFAGQAGLARSLFEDAAGVGDADSVVRGLYWLAVRLATESDPSRGPGLLIAVDDAQWADRPSLRFVAHLARRLEGLPVGVVVGVRSGEPDAPNDLLDPLADLAGVEVVRPTPLSEAAVGRVVDRTLPPADPAFVRACADVTGGNPFLVHELTRALGADGVEPSAGSVPLVQRFVPASVARSVLVRLARLPDAARRLTIAVAVFGTEVPVRLAAALAELPLEVAEDAADTLAATHVLLPGEPLRFEHPLLGAAVHADLPDHARARAHRRAADLLADDSPGRVASHLLLAHPQGDQATVGVLCGAAGEALAGGEPLVAVRLLRRALAEPPADDDERVEVLAALAEAEAQAADRSARQTVAEAMALAASPDGRRRAVIARSRVAYAEGDLPGFAEATEEALADANPEDPATQVLLSGYLAAGTFHGPAHQRTEPHLARLVEQARAGHPPAHPALLAHLALRAALDGSAPAEVRAYSEAALAEDPLIDPAAHAMPLSLVVQALCMVDELDAAERAADAGMVSAQERGAAVAHAVASYHRAIPRYHRGALDEALADLEQAMLHRDDGRRGAEGFHAELLTLVHLARGDLDAASLAAAIGRRVDRDSLDYPMALYARSLWALAADRPAEAAETAQRAGHVLASGFGMDHPGLVQWRCVAARASLRIGDDAQARRLAEDALERARWCGIPRPLGHALRTAGTVTSDGRRLDLLSEADSILADSPAALERAAVLVELGAALRRAGDLTAATDTLRRGYALADGMRAGALVAQAREELRALGLRPRRSATTGLDSLTPAERRVAELASSGLTNRKVAEALFVTMKTVETHLASAYRKLGVSTRHDLARHFADAPLATSSPLLEG